MPKISVIIPVYNVQDFLGKCIDSIIAQTFKDFEIIIVDDGSTDNSGLVAKQYSEKHDNIHLITQENGGQGAARNTGIEAAKGQYLLLIDSDDFITPNTLESLYNKAQETGSDFIIFDLAIENMDGRITKVFNGSESIFENATLEKLPQLLLNSASACNVFYSRELFFETNIRFPGKVWFEDFRTISKLLTLAKRIEYIREPFYHYLQRPGSTMHSPNTVRNGEIMAAMDDIISYYKEHGFYEKYHKELEYLAILHIFIFASVRVLKADRNHYLLKEFRIYLRKNFPNYKHNPYIDRLSKREKVILKLLGSGHYFLLDTLLKVKNSVQN